MYNVEPKTKLTGQNALSASFNEAHNRSVVSLSQAWDVIEWFSRLLDVRMGLGAS